MLLDASGVYTRPAAELLSSSSHNQAGLYSGSAQLVFIGFIGKVELKFKVLE
jgi:hypothetical protein